jgi:mannose-1-phosphate guanylyltransferase/mannose-6-phosphate isomerase
MKIRPIILSGGSGTRLWPVSRRRQPKQFVPLIGSDNLFSLTLKSVANRADFAPPMIIGNIEHKFFILDTLDELGVADAIVLLEPIGRNTAAAAITAAFADPESETLHLVMPSDHVVANQEAFHDAIGKAVIAASKYTFVLFGIKPTNPETGYGYIRTGDAIGDGVFRIASFKEKPDGPTAKELIADGALWNSGIFLYAPRTLMEEAAILAPELTAHCRLAFQSALKDGRCITLDTTTYKAMISAPFDRVIMERTAHGTVIPCDMGWSDVGSWQSMWQLSNKDSHGNFSVGNVITKDVTGSYIRSDGPAVAVLGIDNISVIATKDAVLVAPRNRSQDIKCLLSVVESGSPTLATEHSRVNRPWGTYEGLAQGVNFQVKHIIVKPGRSLSLQKHYHRAEHWVVVAGTAKVECDEVEKILAPNESTYIPLGAVHRLSNPGKADLHLIEVQSGDYLGEDDIVRLEDNYGRIAHEN